MTPRSVLVVGACVEALAAQLDQHVTNHLIRLRRVTAERDALAGRAAADGSAR